MAWEEHYTTMNQVAKIFAIFSVHSVALSMRKYTSHIIFKKLLYFLCVPSRHRHWLICGLIHVISNVSKVIPYHYLHIAIGSWKHWQSSVIAIRMTLSNSCFIFPATWTSIKLYPTIRKSYIHIWFDSRSSTLQFCDWHGLLLWWRFVLF